MLLNSEVTFYLMLHQNYSIYILHRTQILLYYDGTLLDDENIFSKDLKQDQYVMHYVSI